MKEEGRETCEGIEEGVSNSHGVDSSFFGTRETHFTDRDNYLLKVAFGTVGHSYIVAVFFHEVLDDPLPLLSQTMHNDGRESRANGRARGREGRRIESWRENERRKERRSAAGIGVRAPEEGRAGDEDGEGNSGRIPKWRRLERRCHPILNMSRCRRSIATTNLRINSKP